MALVTEHQKGVFVKLGNPEVVPSRENQFVLAGGRVTPVKNRLNMSPSPDGRQLIPEINQTESTKNKSKESTKTSAEFYSTGKKRTPEDKELWSQYPPVNAKIVQPVKLNKEEKRSTSVRNSSILRQRIERDIGMSDHSQEFIDRGLQENQRLATKAPLIRSGKYAMQSGSELNQSYSGMGSQEQLPNEYPNVRYSSNPIGSTKLSSANNVVIKGKINPPVRENMRLNFEDNTDSQFQVSGIGSQASSKTRESNVRISHTSSNTPQFKDQKKVPHADEKKKRVDALEKFVESNYGSDRLGLIGSESRDSCEMNDIVKSELGNSRILPSMPNEKPHQFRRNMYLKTQSTGEKTVGDSEFQESEHRNLNRSRILNSFEKELDSLAEDQIDVEEMHYFFVNFHQKSKQLMSKLK